MSIHIHTISQYKHSDFVKEQRKDPFTKQTIQAEDKVVFCASCKTAFLVSSWETINSKHCNQQNTLQNFPARIQYLNITKKSKSSLIPSNYQFLKIVSFIKQKIFGILTFITQKILKLMDNMEACKVYFIISTIFWGTIWSLGIFFLTLIIVALKHFLVLSNRSTEYINIFDNVILNFILRNIIYFTVVCFFSFKLIFQYIKNADEDEDDFLFDFPWVLCFCFISIIIISLHFELYIFSVIFIENKHI